MEIKVCLNGARYSAEHLETPVTSASLAMPAQTLVAAGTMAIHMHPRDAHEAQSCGCMHVRGRSCFDPSACMYQGQLDQLVQFTAQLVEQFGESKHGRFLDN